MLDNTALKTCSKCLIAKRHSEFTSDPNNKDGLYTQCKVCKASTRRENYIPAVKRTPAERFWKHVAKLEDIDACWLWTAGTVEGYGTLRIEGKKFKAHRLSYELHFGTIPDGLWVLHKCDNPTCVNPNHLFLGTVQDNVEDMMSKGRHRAVKGEEHPNHILTDDKVREIRRLWATGRYTQVEIGKMIGISNTVISEVVRDKHWGHVE